MRSCFFFFFLRHLEITKNNFLYYNGYLHCSDSEYYNNDFLDMLSAEKNVLVTRNKLLLIF
jgi:hypothetical protein